MDVDESVQIRTQMCPKASDACGYHKVAVGFSTRPIVVFRRLAPLLKQFLQQ